MSLQRDKRLDIRCALLITGGEDKTVVQCRDQTVLWGDNLPAE